MPALERETPPNFIFDSCPVSRCNMLRTRPDPASIQLTRLSVLSDLASFSPVLSILSTIFWSAAGDVLADDVQAIFFYACSTVLDLAAVMSQPLSLQINDSFKLNDPLIIHV